MSLVIKGGNVLHAGKFQKLDIKVHDGRIAEIGSGLTDAQTIDAGGCYVLPGFIDVHIHGAMGGNSLGGRQALENMSAALAQHGITGFLPTIEACPPEQTQQALRGVREAMDAAMPGARVLGAHLEGPFLEADCRGALDERCFLLPTLENWRALTGEWESSVRRVTLDPAKPGALEMIDYLNSRGISVSLGHSAATGEEAWRAYDRGAATATHLFNGMKPMHHRTPGLVGASLAHPTAAVELIADLVHVDGIALRVAIAAKGTDRTVLISDAIAALGLPDGDYALGGRPVVVRDGVARVPEGNLAGSTLWLDAAIRKVVGLGVKLEDAAQMASATPARVSGLRRKGAVKKGWDADFAVLDAALEPVRTVIGGKTVWERS